MPIPDRPVSGATIEAEWGQEVHDDTFTPLGFAAHGGTSASVGTTPGGLHFDVADDDPGGWLDAANDRAEVPTGADGLYLFVVRFNTVNGTADDTDTRGYILINGTNTSSVLATNAGGTNVAFVLADMIDLTAGDLISFQAQRRGSGSNPSVTVLSCKVLRMGYEFGA